MKYRKCMRWIGVASALCVFSPAAAQNNVAHPVAVVVAARDISAGERIDNKDLLQRQIAADLVSRSYILPKDAQYIAGQKLLVPVLKGDVMRWQFFETRDANAFEACKHSLADPGTPLQAVARARQAALVSSP